MSSKFRMALAGLTVVALAGGVLAADPADAGKKRKHKKKAKVVKVYKGKSVKQVSKGGDAKAGNGGNGGSGGSSGNVNNTGNLGTGPVFGPPTGPGVGVSDAAAACMFAGVPDAGLNDELVPALVDDCFVGPPPAAFLSCITVAAAEPGGDPELADPEIADCLEVIPGVLITPGSPGGSVFSGTGGNGAIGGNGGNAIGGAGGNNSNSSTSTVTSDDHSIDVD